MPSTPLFCLEFPRALDAPRWRADFRSQCADFVVDEVPGFDFTGSGEHLCVLVSKVGQNSHWVAECLARAFAVDSVAVGYCGRKDRRALTTQWFSVHLPGQTADQPLSRLPGIEGCRYLRQSRHSKKLRRGDHLGNRFRICLRNVLATRAQLEPRLQLLASAGVPNYFGEQRFGRGGDNLRAADRIFRQPRPRFRGQRGGLYLSAARSWLFNLVLGARVRNGTWDRPMPAEGIPEGPLWGRGRSGASPSVAALEEAVLSGWRAWCHGLEHTGLKQERRSLRLVPEGLSWCWSGTDLELEFQLPAGAFATSVLREVALLNTPNPVL